MTENEKIIIRNLSRIRTLPGTWNKRFINTVAEKLHKEPDSELSEKQREWIYRLVYTYRKQLPGTYNRFSHIPECASIKKIKTQ